MAVRTDCLSSVTLGKICFCCLLVISKYIHLQPLIRNNLWVGESFPGICINELIKSMVRKRGGLMDDQY